MGKQLQLAAAALVVLAGASLTSGALGGPIDLGLAWLQTQVLSTGQLAQPSAIAADEQTQCETAKTLVKLAGANPAVAALINTLQPSDSTATQSLACQRTLQRLLGATPAGTLGERRLAGSGFAAYPDHANASLQDTGWALQSELQALIPTDRASVIAWLRAQQNTDGSFTQTGASQGAGPTLVTTANILLGLKDAAASSTVAATTAAQAASYLLAQRDPAGSWAADVAVTAIVFEAVQPYTGSNTGVAAAVQSYLTAQQSANGSWGSDPYVTALALRALYAAGQAPSNPVTPGNQTLVTGSVTSTVNGQPLPGATISVTVQGSTTTALANASGSYSLNAPAGAASVTVSAPGYTTLNTPLTLAAGTTLNFSPGLSTGSQPTSGAQVSGSVAAFGSTGSNSAIIGAQIIATSLAGPATTVQAVSDGLGRFTLNLPAGSFAVSIGATGYQTQTLQLAATDGARAALGQILLRAARTTSTLRGTVQTPAGTAVAGVTVAVTAGGATTNTTSGSNGAYAFTDLAGTSLQVSASAAGYQSTSFSLSLSQPTDIVQDIVMMPTGSAGGVLTLSNISANPVTAGVNQTVTLQVTVSNNSSLSASAGVRLLVMAPGGQTVASLSGLTPQGQPLGTLNLAVGQSQALNFTWNTQSYAAGNYGLVAQLFEVGSNTRLNPSGNILGSLTSGTGIQITAAPHFKGVLVANPPVLQAGTGMAVSLSATLQNDGNVPLAAQSYSLKALDANGASVYSQSASGAAMSLAQLSNLSFPNWVPATAGDYTLQLVAASTPGSLVTQTVHVGDYGQAQFTVNKSVVPPGTQTVRGTINTQGADVANGTLTDPLAPLVKQAITKAVNYADGFAYKHYVNDLQCFACHVQTQTIVGGESNLRFVQPVDRLKRAVLMSGITGFARANGSIQYNDGPPDGSTTVETALSLWAMQRWHAQPAVTNTEISTAAYLMNVQQPNGTWVSDYQGWWRTDPPVTALGASGLVDMRKAAAAGATSTLPSFVPMAVTGLPSGGMKLAADSSGRIYVAHPAAQQIWAVEPGGGAASLLVNNIPVTQISLAADGRLLAAASTGVFQVQPATGAVQQLSTLPALDVKPLATANQYVVVGADHQAYVLNGSTGATQLLTDGTGNTPYGANIVAAAVDGDGNILLADRQVNRNVRGELHPTGAVLRVNPGTGQIMGSPIPRPFDQPLVLAPYGSGYLLSTDAGLFRYDTEWVAERWTFEGVDGIAQLPGGGVAINYRGALYVASTPVGYPNFIANLDAAIARVTPALLGGTGVDPQNNLELAFQLIGLGKLKAHYALGTPEAASVATAINSVATVLQGRQQADGGWFWRQDRGLAVSDSMVTAMVGVALDILNPSPTSAQVRNAVQLLLSRQQPDGTWLSENGYALGLMTDSPNLRLMPSTWVEIWLPVMLDRLGGIDTEVGLTLPVNVTLSNPDVTPTSATLQADGSTSYVWKLTGVTSAGQQLNFDLGLQNLAIGETRTVASDARLTFANSFTAGTVTTPLLIPSVTVDPGLTIAVATDKPSYTEADQALFTATVSNSASLPRDAQVRFTVLDANGQTVTVLPLPASVNAAAGASTPVLATWPTVGTLSGPYQVKAELITVQGSASGAVYGSALAPFTLASSQSTQLSARIRTDASRYSAAQTVQITSQVSNLTSNSPLNDLRAVTDVLNASGQIATSFTETLTQLTPAALRQYSYPLAASSLAPGAYTARLRVSTVAAPGTILVEQSTAFTVLDSSQTGIGITGQLQAQPGTAPIGQPVALSLALANAGNAAFSNGTVRVRLLDPATGNVLATYTQAAFGLAIGAQQTLAWNWTAAGTAGNSVVAAATIELVTGAEIPLSQANILLAAPPAPPLQPLTGTVSASPKSVASGAAVQLLYTAQNPNTRAVQATLILSISPSTTSGTGTGTVTSTTTVAQWPLAQTLAANGSFSGNQAWVPTGTPGTSYRATWSATMTSTGTSTGTATGTATGTVTAVTTTILATDSFSITVPTPPAVQVTAQAGTATTPRLLMLVSCAANDDANQAASPACDEPKAQAVRDYLSSIGVFARVVTSRAELETELRCGNYNVFWVSGGSAKLTDTNVKELREAAERGAGLVLDGAPNSRDSILQSVLGVNLLGSSSSSAPVATLNGSLYPAGGLNTLGKPTRYSLLSASTNAANTTAPTVQATLAGGSDPAIVSRSIGQGYGITFAFNLASIMAQAPSVTSGNSLLADVVRRSLSYLSAASPSIANTPVQGAPQSLATDLRNTGTQDASVSLQATLPAGVKLLNAQPLPSPQYPSPQYPSPQANGTTLVNWSLSLPAGQTATVIVQVSTPTTGTSTGSGTATYTIPVQVQTSAAGGGGSLTTSQTVTHTLTISPAATLTASATQTLATLTPTPQAEATAANTARTAAASAASLMAQARYAESLAQWTSAADAVRSIASANTSSQRQAIAQALQAAERQLCGQWGCITGELDFTFNNQVARQVPLQATIQGSRTIYNNCPAQVKDIPVTSLWVNRRTGASVQNLWDNLTIPGYSNNRRDNGWQALGQENDIIDVTLTAQWPTANDLLFLDRDQFRIIVLPPVLSGTVSINPSHAKAGQNVTISRSITNSGAMGSNIPVKLRITDTTNGGTLVQEISQTLTLNPGETNNGNSNWQVQGTAGHQLKVELNATVGGTVQILGTASFTVDP